jgi:hypothetical protein
MLAASDQELDRPQPVVRLHHGDRGESRHAGDVAEGDGGDATAAIIKVSAQSSAALGLPRRRGVKQNRRKPGKAAGQLD